MSTIGLLFGEITAAAAAKPPMTNVFDGIELPVQSDWSPEQAYLCLLLSGVFADGKATDSETEYVRGLVKRCRALRGKTPNELAQLNVEVLERMRSRPDHVAEACRALPRDMHLPVFTHCVDVVLADGELVQTERQFLDQLMEKLAMTPEQARKILEVIFEKNRY